MAKLLVTLGTDGTKDWVQTPDGRKHSLGSVSPLYFVSKLSATRRVAKLALDAFLQDGSAMFAVNPDTMWEILAPRRARWAAANGPFMSPD